MHALGDRAGGHRTRNDEHLSARDCVRLEAGTGQRAEKYLGAALECEQHLGHHQARQLAVEEFAAVFEFAGMQPGGAFGRALDDVGEPDPGGVGGVVLETWRLAG
jgi:hypothetical protein